MQGPFDSSAIIVPESADTLGNVVDVILRDLGLTEVCLSCWEAGLGLASKVHNYLKQVFGVRSESEGLL